MTPGATVRSRHETSSAEPRRIILLKPCCLGDLVQMTAVLAALRERWPAAQIAVGTGAWSLPAVAHHPAVDETLDVGLPGLRSRKQRQDALRASRLLRRGRFDLAVVPDRSPVLCLLTSAAGIRRRVGLDSGGRGRLYTVRVRPLPDTHELDQASHLLTALGIPRLPDPCFHPGEAGLAEAARWHQDLPSPFAILAPGGGENPGTSMLSKRWQPQGFAAVAIALLEEHVTVAIVGGPNDCKAASQVAALAPGTRNLCSKLSLAGLGALLQRARLFVGNDSAAAHLAAASGCPTVAIFGPTDPRLYGPRGPWVRTLQPPAGWRIGGAGSVRSPYRFHSPWQAAVSPAQVLEVAWEGLRVRTDRATHL